MCFALPGGAWPQTPSIRLSTGHHLAGVEQQHRQQCALTPPERDGAPVQLDFERAQAIRKTGCISLPRIARAAGTRPIAGPVEQSRSERGAAAAAHSSESIGAPGAPPAIRGATCRTTMERNSARARSARIRASHDYEGTQLEEMRAPHAGARRAGAAPAGATRRRHRTRAPCRFQQRAGHRRRDRDCLRGDSGPRDLRTGGSASRSRADLTPVRERAAT